MIEAVIESGNIWSWHQLSAILSKPELPFRDSFCTGLALKGQSDEKVGEIRVWE
jgi:hypothetical protein